MLFLMSCQRQETGFVLELESATTRQTQEVRRLLEQADLGRVLKGLNGAFRLPRLVPVVFREGEEVALYEEGRIIICYDFIGQLDEALKPKYSDPAQRHRILLGHAHFVLYHEVGHALVDMLDIPVVGQEEDAVDGLATIIAVGVLKQPDLAVGAVALDSLDHPEGEFQPQDYWDKHSLDAQRYYNILCWVHGGAPELCEGMVRELVPEDWFESRAQDCPEEYERLRRNWGRLLEPHFRPGVKLLARVKRAAEARERGE